MMKFKEKARTRFNTCEKLYKHSLVIAPILITMLLSGCASNPITKVEYVTPPKAYLMPCVKTPFTGKTYGDAVEHLIVVTAELDICASQIDNINKWIAKGGVK